MKVMQQFNYSTISATKDNELHLVLALTAPKMQTGNKVRVAVMPCIDTSGSMAGDKLQYAKQSVCKLIDHLSPTDQAGVVAFSDSASLISPILPMTPSNKEKMKLAVNKLQARGGTAFSAGMLMALKEMEGVDVGEAAVKRVILFTDGQGNIGPSSSQDILQLIPSKLGTSSVSAFGYGEGADQMLLGAVSTAGNGNYAFIKDVDDAPTAFAKELGSLLSLHAHNIKINLLPNGCKINKIVSDVKFEQKENDYTLSIPELLSEEVRYIVLSVNVLKGAEVGEGKEMMKVKATFMTTNPAGEEVVEGSATINITDGKGDDAPNQQLEEIVTLAQMVRAQMDAVELAERGDYRGAAATMDSFSNMAGGKLGMGKFAAYAASNASTMKSGHSYLRAKSNIRSSMSVGTRGYGSASVDADAVATISSLVDNSNFSFSNSLQDNLVEDFNESDPDVKP